MNKLTLEEAAGVYSGTAHDAKPHPMHIERNKAFKAGAEWQRNHVWQDTAQLPEEGKIAAILTNCKHLIIIEVNKDWENLIKSFKGQAWAYYENLLPTSIDCIIEEDKALLLKQFNERKERHERWRED